MHVPEGLFYHPEHTWARIEGKEAVVGITDFAQEELGDIIFVELPEMGKKLKAGEVFGTVESSKSVSELYCPLDGEVTAVNTRLEDSPEKINDDPYGEGWIVRVRLTGTPAASLLDAVRYAAHISKG
jgi:glycine cleavage system H protein